MSTLETNLQNLITAKTDIENAIIAKGGTVTGGGSILFLMIFPVLISIKLFLIQ